MSKRYAISQLDELPSQPCPCGTTRRAFLDEPEKTASVHLVDIATTARAHYHREHTEIYVVLEGEGYLELDGERVPVRPMSTVTISQSRSRFFSVSAISMILCNYQPSQDTNFSQHTVVRFDLLVVPRADWTDITEQIPIHDVRQLQQWQFFLVDTQFAG